jgi:MFS family permease
VDFGLTLAQYSYLNVAWAVAIVLFEVPSGALADVWGRRNLVILSSFLMFIEMSVMVFAPVGDSIGFLFPLFLLNRVISGIAEAAASGADEALAYDSICENNAKELWPDVLERLSKLSSLLMGAAMLIGAFVYDSGSLNTVLGWLGTSWILTPEMTLKFPLILTWTLSLGAIYAAIKMNDPKDKEVAGENNGRWTLFSAAFQQTLETAKWIFSKKLVFVTILAAFLFDSVVRMMMTLSSNFFRLIQIPEYMFGALGLVMSASGFVSASVARKCVSRFSALQNMGLLFVWTLAHLVLMSFAWDYWGALFMMLLGMGFGFLNFMLSHYLNDSTPSDKRATVLSFKGLALNLGYGAIGLLYAQVLAHLRNVAPSEMGASSGGLAVEDWVMKGSLAYFAPYFVVGFIVLLLYIYIIRPKKA